MPFNPQGLRQPDYHFPVTECGFVINDDLKVIGFQFVDPEGKQWLLSLPGKLVAGLAEHLPKLLAQHPHAANYKPMPLAHDTSKQH